MLDQHIASNSSLPLTADCIKTIQEAGQVMRAKCMPNYARLVVAVDAYCCLCCSCKMLLYVLRARDTSTPAEMLQVILMERGQ